MSPCVVRGVARGDTAPVPPPSPAPAPRAGQGRGVTPRRAAPRAPGATSVVSSVCASMGPSATRQVNQRWPSVTPQLHVQTDGSCRCGPGYQGASCSQKCDEGRWGQDCEGECGCGPGQRCHHVTGDCVPCEEGAWGPGCAQACDCDQGGTALCSHLDGRCFCEGNYFGARCEHHCPFGYDKKLGCFDSIEVRNTD